MLAKEKTINQDTCVENTELDPCECGQCIFNSGPKAINQSKDRCFNLWYYNKITFTYKKNWSGQNHTLFTKIQSRSQMPR